jgi:hypothetical protein
MSTAQNRKNQMSSVWEEASSAPREWMEEHPLPSTLVSFGIGIGIGVIIGHALAGSSRHEAESSTMEKFGRQAFEALRGSIPEALSRHLPR